MASVMDHEDRLIRLLRKAGYIETLGYPTNYLDIEWSSFEGYLNYLKKISKNIVKNIKLEMNRNKKSGVTYSVLSHPLEYEDRMWELINNNYVQHNEKSFPFTKEYLKKS